MGRNGSHVTTTLETATNGGPARPHGGRLVERWLDPDQSRAAERLPALRLTPAEAADLRAIATGVYSPLEGFMGRSAHEAVVEGLHSDDGTLWPIPVCLGLPDGAELGERAALRGQDGELLGVLEVSEVFERDREREAKLVYGTGDPAHPGVARVLDSPARAFAERGWGRIAAFQTRNPVHRAHEYLLKCALEVSDGLLLHPLVGPTKDGDVPVEVRLRAYEAVLGYFPADRVVLAALVAPMRYAGPREAVLHALVRKNHGCTHFIVGRDHAGVGAYYGTYEAQELIASLPPEELGITPLLFDNAFWCRACGAMATAKTCPHPRDAHVSLSGTQVRAMLAAGELPPPEFSRPEVAAVLREAYQAGAA